MAKQTAPLNAAVKPLRIARPDQILLAKNLEVTDLPAHPKNRLASASANPGPCNFRVASDSLVFRELVEIFDVRHRRTVHSLNFRIR